MDEKIAKIKEAYIDILLKKLEMERENDNVDLLAINDGIRMLGYMDKFTKSNS